MPIRAGVTVENTWSPLAFERGLEGEGDIRPTRVDAVVDRTAIGLGWCRVALVRVDGLLQPRHREVHHREALGRRLRFDRLDPAVLGQAGLGAAGHLAAAPWDRLRRAPGAGGVGAGASRPPDRNGRWGATAAMATYYLLTLLVLEAMHESQYNETPCLYQPPSRR